MTDTDIKTASRRVLEEIFPADDEIALAEMISEGRHTGDFFGLPATGRGIAYRKVHIIRFADGNGAEHWAVRDDAALMRQLATPDPLSADQVAATADR